MLILVEWIDFETFDIQVVSISQETWIPSQNFDRLSRKEYKTVSFEKITMSVCRSGRMYI